VPRLPGLRLGDEVRPGAVGAVVVRYLRGAPPEDEEARGPLEVNPEEHNAHELRPPEEVRAHEATNPRGDSPGHGPRRHEAEEAVAPELYRHVVVEVEDVAAAVDEAVRWFK